MEQPKDFYFQKLQLEIVSIFFVRNAHLDLIRRPGCGYVKTLLLNRDCLRVIDILEYVSSWPENANHIPNRLARSIRRKLEIKLQNPRECIVVFLAK